MVRRFIAILLSALLAGCGGMRLVHSDVAAISAFQAGEPAAGASFRFERLPSQQMRPQAQDELEAIVERALAKVSMQRGADPAQARFVVLATARTVAFVINDAGSLFPIGAGHGNAQVAIGIGGPSRSMAIMWPLMNVTYLYRSEATLVLRETQSMQIVYETRATHEGPWPDTPVVLAAMFDAALKDFPKPPSGLRRVRVEIPR